MNYGPEPKYSFYEGPSVKISDVKDLEKYPSTYLADGEWKIKVEKPVIHKQAESLSSRMSEIGDGYFLFFKKKDGN